MGTAAAAAAALTGGSPPKRWTPVGRGVGPKGVAMEARFIVIAACVLIAVLSVPLILRKVPPNALYGFRTPLTRSSPEVWYPANAYAGKALLGAAALAGIGTWLLPGDAAEWVPVALIVAGVVAAAVASFLHLQNYR